MDEDLKKDARELLIQVRRVRIAYTSFLTKLLDGMGTNIPQYTALAILDEKGEVTMGTLAEALGITMGAVTNIVDRLIDGGWATRERGTDDRRVVRVKLTETGRATLEKAVGAGADYFSGWLATVPHEERRTFIRVYRRVAELIANQDTGAST